MNAIGKMLLHLHRKTNNFNFKKYLDQQYIK